ncbi:MAG: TetR/AcrR family transcriptional regulator [Spirochaeta sp.]|jgi:AcrR family transcriptional regulator|nr:TetR/AcrR family transcriptional regulator [Spirochaeta sp.]
MSQQEPRENSRNKILDAAETLFREHGFHAVSLFDVAAAVGIRKPSLYHHFPKGKEELFIAVQDRMFLRIGGDLDGLLGHVRDSLEPNANLFEKGIHATAHWLLARPPLFLLSMMHHDMPGLSDESRSHLIQSSYGVIMRPIVDLVRDAQIRGDVREIEPHTVAGGFLSLIEGTIIAAQAGLGTELTAMVEATTDMLVHGTIQEGSGT